MDYFLTDHLGSVRVIVDGTGKVLERNDYYPFGARQARSDYSQLVSNRYKYNGKEEQVTGDLKYLDYGARMYDSGLGRWFGVDPKAERYLKYSVYSYCINNPMRYMDPNGEKIVGVTKNDVKLFLQDLNNIFAGEKFEALRNLFTLKGKRFNFINLSILNDVLENIDLTIDERVLIDEYVTAINSDEIHKIEFVDINSDVSIAGSEALKKHLNKEANGFGDKMIPNSQISGKLLNSLSGGGLNIPTSNGSHSIIMTGSGVVYEGNRAVTSGHEVVGHGVAAAHRVFGKPNNTRAIRVENLIRRVMGIGGFRNEHGGALIVKPNALPDKINKRDK